MTHIKLFPRPTDGPLLIHIDPFMSIYNFRIRPGPVINPSIPRRPRVDVFLFFQNEIVYRNEIVS